VPEIIAQEPLVTENETKGYEGNNPKIKDFKKNYGIFKVSEVM